VEEKAARINAQPLEDIVYIKRRFAALRGSCADIADHTNGHIFESGISGKKASPAFVFRIRIAARSARHNPLISAIECTCFVSLSFSLPFSRFLFVFRILEKFHLSDVNLL